MINDSGKTKTFMYGLKKWLKIDLIYLKGLTMENNELKKIASLIRFDWQINHRDEDEVRYYAGVCGYCFETAEQFIFDMYLENFSEKGKPTHRWSSLVDSVMLTNGYQMNTIYDMTELDYQLIWGYINRDIDDKVEENIRVDAIGLAMIK